MKRNRAVETGMSFVFLLCGLASVAFVLGICAYLVLAGLPAIREIGLRAFLAGDVWSPSEEQYGILPFLLASVAGTAGAVLLGVPIGILTALFLAKAAPPKLALLIRTAVELLAGIPSIVYGLVGMILLVPAIQRTFRLASGATLLAAVLVLAVMVLPAVVSVSETALAAVPKEYEEASLALGATWMETVFRVTLPAAGSGIATAAALGAGRAIGEAMAVMLVSGNVANLPGSLFTPVRLLTTAIASEMSYASGLHRMALYSIGLVLLLFILLMNTLLRLCLRGRKEGR